MDIRIPTDSRGSGCSRANLSFCRRVQILVFIVIFITYLAFMVHFLALTFIGEKVSIDVLNKNTSNPNDVSSDNAEYLDNKTLTKPSAHQGINYCKGSCCVKNCCPSGRRLVLINITTCVLNSVDNTNNLRSFIENTARAFNKNTTEEKAASREAKCEPNTAREFDIRKVNLTTNGSIKIEGNKISFVCLNYFVKSEIIFAEGCNETLDAYEDDEEYENEVLSAETGLFIAFSCLVFMIVSTLSIAATLIVYSCTPQLLNIYGKIIICYLVSIVVFDLTFIGSIAYDIVYDEKHYIIELLSTASLLSWMSWLTVLCFDIWANFSHPLDVHPRLRNSNQKFKLYSFGVWSNVVLHTTLQWVVTLNSESFIMPLFVRFGVAVNVVMFLATVHNLRFHKVNISGFNHSGDTRKEGVILYTKLSLLMGLDWLLILSCQHVGGFFGVFTSFIILESQGITLFFLLVCNKRVLRFLSENCI